MILLIVSEGFKFIWMLVRCTESSSMKDSDVGADDDMASEASGGLLLVLSTLDCCIRKPPS